MFCLRISVVYLSRTSVKCSLYESGCTRFVSSCRELLQHPGAERRSEGCSEGLSDVPRQCHAASCRSVLPG